MKDPKAWTAPGSRPSEGPDPLLPVDPPAAPGGPAGNPFAAPARTGPRPAIDRSELLGGDIPLRPLGLSEVLDGAITNIRRNPRSVLGLSLLISSVVQVLVSVGSYFYIGGGGHNEVVPNPVLQTLGARPTLIALVALLAAYTVLLMAGLLGPSMGRTLFGLSTSLRQTWRHGRPCLGRLAAVALAGTAICLLAMVVPVIPFFASALTGAPAVVGVLTGLIGFPLSAGLTIWLYLRLVLAAPAAVMERQRPINALRRASRLVHGRWWHAFAVMSMTVLITFFIMLASLVPLLLLRLLLFGSQPDGAALVSSIALDTLGRILAMALLTAFDAGVIALFYIDQRIRREGFDLELRTRPEQERIPADFMDLWRTSPLVPRPGRTARPASPPEGRPS